MPPRLGTPVIAAATLTDIIGIHSRSDRERGGLAFNRYREAGREHRRVRTPRASDGSEASQVDLELGLSGWPRGFSSTVAYPVAVNSRAVTLSNRRNRS